MTFRQRLAGVLLHPTSLPGPYGIGDLGLEALRFLDWLKDAGVGLWQVLPLGPTGYGDSPYQCFSAFAGNTFLISPDVLKQQGVLKSGDMKRPQLPNDRVDFGPVIEWKSALLREAYANFQKNPPEHLTEGLEAFRNHPIHSKWLEDYALFIALKEAHGGRPWNEWHPDLRSFQKKAVNQARKEHAAEIEYQIFAQYLFFSQWNAILEAAHERNISIVGDMPIYVAYDSADTWASQDLFQLKKDGTPTHVAGVPPDYFSATGQLWGNPLYNWDVMKQQRYKWWISRFQAVLEQVDYIRLDHFRGFEGYWSVPYGHPTAVKGRWEPGPRSALFARMREKLGSLPIIAEDLGVITPEVTALRTEFDLPGMKVLQFAWTPASAKKPLVPDLTNVFKPHNAEPTSVVYTGTHDNPTTVQWWKDLASPAEKALMKAYLQTDGSEPHWDLIRAAFRTPSNAAIIPMQDLLGIGAEGRMNFPGRESGNWSWRMAPGAASKALAKRIREMLIVYERHKDQSAIVEELLAQETPEERARKP